MAPRTELESYFDDPEGSFAQNYLPDGVQLGLYAPTGEGWEARVAARWNKLRDAHGEGNPERAE